MYTSTIEAKNTLIVDINIATYIHVCTCMYIYMHVHVHAHACDDCALLLCTSIPSTQLRHFVT